MRPQIDATAFRGIKVSRYDYILTRIAETPFTEVPFRHLHIADLLDAADFQALITAPEIAVPPVESDEALIAALHDLGYKEINFPGTTTDLSTYLDWHRERKRQSGVNSHYCEGFGVTLRLQRMADDSPLRALDAFFRSTAFVTALADKFGIAAEDCHFDAGLQKYLDGYEISPHPDIRRKALTLMFNINPAPNSEDLEIHTHYLRFRPDWQHIGAEWTAKPHVERSWVPWDWCDTVSRQTANNSIVIFSPNNDTLHAVKANYDHLATQRTQYYANMWYKTNPTEVAQAQLAG